MPYAFILNPSANRKRAKDAELWLRSHVDKLWPGSEILVTSSKADISRAVKEAILRYDTVVACGGDGTVNEVFSRCVEEMQAKPGLTMGVLPMGSGNDFAKSVGLSTDPRVAIHQLKESLPTSIDYVTYKTNLGSGCMFNTLNIGLGGQINLEASKVQRLKGPLIYIYAALKSLMHIVPVDVQLHLDGVSTHERMVMISVANGAVEGGNFKVAPNATNRDGMLDIITVRPLPAWRLLPLLPLFLFAKQMWYKSVTHRRAKVLKLMCSEPVPLHVDGEQCGLDVNFLELALHEKGIMVLSRN